LVEGVNGGGAAEGDKRLFAEAAGEFGEALFFEKFAVRFC